ncbi:MAG: DUF4391 family protein [Candidatus Moranbacteria bacterium]|nr:DUF4391 family protein [Candidatus Moranbacteria bacterium]
MEWKLPAQSHVAKNIPKNTFFSRTKVNTKLKNSLTHTLQKIIWEYKLSPETIGIPKTNTVEEIQIFTLYLKKYLIPKDILTLIDKTIPYPILFVGIYEQHTFFAISLKPKGQDRWYISEWDKHPNFSFSGTHLEKVYENIVRAFLTLPHPKDDIHREFAILIEEDAQKKRLTKEIQALENKIRTERQFKKKVELNIQLQDKKKELKNPEIKS